MDESGVSQLESREVIDRIGYFKNGNYVLGWYKIIT